MRTFLEEDLVEDLIEKEIDRLKEDLDRALMGYKMYNTKDGIYDILEKIRKLSELKVEIQVAKTTLRKLQEL